MVASLFTIAQMAIDECNGEAAFLIIVNKYGDISTCLWGVSLGISSSFILSKAITESIEIDGYTLDGKVSPKKTTKSLSKIADIAINARGGKAAIIITMNKDGDLCFYSRGLTTLGKIIILTTALNDAMPLNYYKLDKNLKGKDAIFS